MLIQIEVTIQILNFFVGGGERKAASDPNNGNIHHN